MLDDLPDSTRIVGMKQVMRAAESGKARHVFIAEDADEYIQNKVRGTCMELGIEFEYVSSMLELGQLCGIDVGAACAAILGQ